MVVNYSLTIKNSSRSRDVIFVAHIQAVIQGEGDQLIFQRESLFQRFAKVGKRLLKLKIVIVIDSVLKRGIVLIHDLLGVSFQQRIEFAGR